MTASHMNNNVYDLKDSEADFLCIGDDVSTAFIKVHKLLENLHFRRMSKSVWNLTVVKLHNCLDSDVEN